jgi:hypothetical protein
MSQIRKATIDDTLQIMSRASGTDWLNGAYEYKVDRNRHWIKYKVQPLGIVPSEMLRI